jgi:hypothetical protein
MFAVCVQEPHALTPSLIALFSVVLLYPTTTTKRPAKVPQLFVHCLHALHSRPRPLTDTPHDFPVHCAGATREVFDQRVEMVRVLLRVP